MLMPYTTTPTELQRNYKKVLKKAKKAKDAVIVMSNNVPQGVYMDYRTYMNKKLNSDRSKLFSFVGTMLPQEADKLSKDMDKMFEVIHPEDWK